VRKALDIAVQIAAGWRRRTSRGSYTGLSGETVLSGMDR